MFVKKITRILELCDGLGRVQFTLFMDLRQQQLFAAQANRYPDVKTAFVCGYEGEGERKLAVCCPEYMDTQTVAVPLVILRAKLNDTDLSHKDFLGAAMSLKIDREYMGDIIISDGYVYMICHKNVADIIKDELISVKRSLVSFEVWDGPLSFEKQYTEQRTTTVASLRADSVVAAVLNKSRTEAAKLIKQGNVKVNQMDVENVDFEIFDNDIISIRYNGKFKIFCDGGKSRKDRIFITVAKY
ncbi:MAG: hypothetical protein IJO54_04295 [Oscillospiraceae bacterium]|nr:hypothetical protein [Oscillospiraceae bacterium]